MEGVLWRKCEREGGKSKTYLAAAPSHHQEPSSSTHHNPSEYQLLCPISFLSNSHTKYKEGFELGGFI